MTSFRSIVILLAGVAAGCVLVVACSDDSPSDADAAVCDCPAAEPPLAGRIVRVRDTNTIQPGGGGAAGPTCPTGAVALGGACQVMNDDDRIQVQESRFITVGADQGYQCRWTGRDATVANMGTAEVVCLVPAQ